MNFRQSLSLAAVFVGLALTTADAQLTGDGTPYGSGSGPVSGGNCNFMAAAPEASSHYVAIYAAQWQSTRNCGRCVTVSCTDSRCTDKTKTQLLYVTDQCPECKQGDLDMSPVALKAITGATSGRYKIKWNFVDCPISSPLKYCLKGGSNAYWIAVQPANSAVGIKSVTINGKSTSMVPSSFYYLATSSTPVDLKKVTVSVTSINGETITETVALSVNGCTTGKKQFSTKN